MRKYLEIARTGVVAVRLHRLRSAVTVASLAALLAPYLAGLAVSRGIERQAEDSIRLGANLYVTGQRFGQNVPVPLAAIDRIRRIEGVTQVLPRIIGSITLGKDRHPAVLVGLPAEHLPPAANCLDGRLYAAGKFEFVVGSELAGKLSLQIGSAIPPFYRSSQGERVSRVVGVFRPEAPLWQSNLMLTSFETASAIFDQPGRATDLLVYCRPGYEDRIRAAVLRGALLDPLPDAARLGATTRGDLEAVLPRGLLHREGIFNLHFAVALALGIPILLVTSGAGLAERRREVGILKATGWQTDEVLLRGMTESAFLGLAAASAAVLVAFVWLRLLNGAGVAGIFFPGADASPGFVVPFRLTPLPAFLSLVLSCVLVASGTLYSIWRAATAPPWEAMR